MYIYVYKYVQRINSDKTKQKRGNAAIANLPTYANCRPTHETPHKTPHINLTEGKNVN